MSFPRSQSPPLPTFGIRDLAGSSNAPGLISITRRQYDSTITSQPDAALLYFDDDDGELITVGSSLELSQRLEEPVPRYAKGNPSELRHPLDGQLVHIFDIARSSASLAEWRDHAAYSSKALRPDARPAQPAEVSPLNMVSDREAMPVKKFQEQRKASAIPGCVEAAPAEKAAETAEQWFETQTQNDQPESSQAREQKTLLETLNITAGIQAHLSGLASVLQVAANTLQKAADKTRETDTSVVEDILLGVKGILTEVGSFGVEVLREIARDDADESSTPESTQIHDRAGDASGKGKEPATVTADEVEVLVEPGQVNGGESEPETETETEYITHSDASSKRSSKVKFAFFEDESSEKSTITAGSTSGNPFSVDEESSDSMSDKVKSSIETIQASPVNYWGHVSILDHSSEDAEFTARYPPLNSLRRARSTLDSGRAGPYTRGYGRFYDDLAKPALPLEQPPNQPSKDLFQRAIAWQRKAREEEALTITSLENATSEPKTEPPETMQKPLPGAWPDAKNEIAPTLPLSTNRPAAFWQHMAPYNRFQPMNGGLHRANTTASSNPASRLTGPFDPGFPYQPPVMAGSSFQPRYSSFLRSHNESPAPWELNQTKPETKPVEHYYKGLSGPGTSQTSTKDRVDQASTYQLLPTSPEEGSLSRQDEDSDAESMTSSLSSLPSAVPHKPAPYSFSRPSTSSPSLANNHRPGPSKFDSYAGVRHHRSVPHFNPYMPYRTQPYLPPSRAPSSAQSMPMRARTVAHKPVHFHPSANPSWTSTPSNMGRGPTTKSDLPHAPHALNSNPTPIFPIPVPTQAPPQFSLGNVNSETASWNPGVPHEPLAGGPIIPPPVPTAQVPSPPDKIDACVEQLKMCGFGIDDENLKDRLFVYAVAADGNVHEAVDMIEEDRRLSRSFN